MKEGTSSEGQQIQWSGLSSCLKRSTSRFCTFQCGEEKAEAEMADNFSFTKQVGKVSEKLLLTKSHRWYSKQHLLLLLWDGTELEEPQVQSGRAFLPSGFLDSFLIVIQGQSEVHKPRNIWFAKLHWQPLFPGLHQLGTPSQPQQRCQSGFCPSPCALHPGGAGQLPNTTAGKNPTVGAKGEFQVQWLTLEWSKARRSKCSRSWH